MMVLRNNKKSECYIYIWQGNRMPEEQTEEIFTKLKKILGLRRYFLKKRFMLLLNFFQKKFSFDDSVSKKLYLNFYNKYLHLRKFFLTYLNIMINLFIVNNLSLVIDECGKRIKFFKRILTKNKNFFYFLFKTFKILVTLIKHYKNNLDDYSNKRFNVSSILASFHSIISFLDSLIPTYITSNFNVFYRRLTKIFFLSQSVKLALQKIIFNSIKNYLKIKFLHKVLLSKIRNVYKSLLANPFYVARISYGKETFGLTNRYNLKVMQEFFSKYFNKIAYNGCSDIKNPFFVHIRPMNKLVITSSFLARYLSIKLLQRHRLLQTLNPVFRDLKQNSRILGYRIACSGRFTKKEIATYEWYQAGSLPTNKLRAHLDYAFIPFIMKYSVCCFKVWIHNLRRYVSQKNLFVFLYKQIDIISGKKTTRFFRSQNEVYNKKQNRKHRRYYNESKKKELKKTLQIKHQKKKHKKRYFYRNQLKNLKIEQKTIRSAILSRDFLIGKSYGNYNTIFDSTKATKALFLSCFFVCMSMTKKKFKRPFVSYITYKGIKKKYPKFPTKNLLRHLYIKFAKNLLPRIMQIFFSYKTNRSLQTHKKLFLALDENLHTRKKFVTKWFSSYILNKLILTLLLGRTYQKSF
jgi:ribosomal protein S3